MKHYKDPNTNEIYAYEADGSQDAWIKPGLVPVTDEQAEEVRQQNQQNSFNSLTYQQKRITECSNSESCDCTCISTCWSGLLQHS